MKTESYIQWICYDCGIKHCNRPPGLACWHVGECNVCKETKPVTEPRDFGYIKQSDLPAILKRQAA